LSAQKVNFTQEEVMKAQMWNRGIYSFVDLGARWRWVVNARHRSLYLQERHTLPIVQEVAWTSGPVLTGLENLAPTKIRSPDLPAIPATPYQSTKSVCGFA
jgi:hypothetical protein